MKQILFPLLLLSALTYSCSRSNTCESVKEGRFRIAEGSIDKSYIIERKDSVQYEENTQTGERSTYRIHWTSDCTYTLSIIKGSQESMDFYKDRDLSVEITEVTEKGYDFEAKIEGFEKSFDSKAYRLID